MKPQTLMMIVLALAFAGSAAFLINGMGSSRAEVPVADNVSVVVASVEVPRGSAIKAENLASREFPRPLVPSGAFTKVEDVIGRVSAVSIVKDEPVLESKLAPKGTGAGMASLLGNGWRAFTIQTPNISSGVGGFIQAGNRVDVLLTMKENGDADSGGGITSTLLQKVEILAVDQRTEAAVDNKVDANQLRSVTLKVTPLQAKQLNLGQSQGTLHLVLRSPTDDSEDTSRPATMLSLRYKQEKPWDERAKSVLLALGQALKERKPVEVAPEPAPVAAPPVPVTPPAPKLPPMIRTIRGTQEGATYVRPPAFSPPDR